MQTSMGIYTWNGIAANNRVYASAHTRGHGREAGSPGLTSRHAKLAVGAASTLFATLPSDIVQYHPIVPIKQGNRPRARSSIVQPDQLTSGGNWGATVGASSEMGHELPPTMPLSQTKCKNAKSRARIYIQGKVILFWSSGPIRKRPRGATVHPRDKS